jgi:hypothetical protein
MQSKSKLSRKKLLLNFLPKAAIFLLVFTITAKFCIKKTDGFTVAGVCSNRPYNSAWETRSLSNEENAEIAHVLKQKYTYFGCGGQSFIFFSEDGKYALKLFKQCKFTLPLWLKYVRIPWVLDRYREKKIWTRQDKLMRDFTSYKIAFEELQEETGIIYVHLNKTNYLQSTLTIVDKLGINHHLDLDSLDFVVQRHADLVFPRITMLMTAGKIDEAKQAIASVLNLIVTRCKKGFHDRDPNIATNCGFIKDHAIKIDVGRFVRIDQMKQPEVYRKEVVRISHPFQEWIGTNHPTLSPFFQEEIDRILTTP